MAGATEGPVSDSVQYFQLLSQRKENKASSSLCFGVTCGRPKELTRGCFKVLHISMR